MKKMLKHLLAFTFVISVLFAGKALTVNAYSETPYNGTYYAKVVDTKGSYVYLTPDLNGKKNDGGVSYGWTVKCLAYTSNGFTKIQFYYGKTSNTFVGYVLSTKLGDVTKTEDTDTNKTEKFTKIYGYTGVVTTNGGHLNVHSAIKAKGNDATVFTAIPNKTVVNVLAKSANWYQIKFNYNGKATTGYVSRKYMKVVDALKKVYITIPTKVFSSSQKYQLVVVDPTVPYALDKKITWTSSKKSVASVSKKGYVTAKNEGKATLTCKIKCGDRSRKIKIKIKVTDTYDLVP